MRTWIALAVGLVTASTMIACGSKAGTLQGSADALGAADTRTIEYSGTGKWFQFGQAPNPTLPWPAFDVSAYTASINYEAPAARIQMTRKQVVEPGRARPAPVDQKPDQYISGNSSLEHGSRCGRRASRAASPGCRRRADDGDLVDTTGFPEGCDGEQRNVTGDGHRFRGDLHSRQE